jgi:multiple sugar transport system substrate-binding protein
MPAPDAVTHTPHDRSARRLTRRAAVRTSIALSGAATAVLTAACGSPGEGKTPPAGDLSRAPATVTFLGRGSVTNQQSFQELAQRFSRENPGITVEYTHEAGNFDEKYQVLAAGGQTPDVAFGTVANFKSHVARGLAAYVDDLAKRDRQFKEQEYDEYWLVALKYKGRLAGLPWDPGMVVLYFNRNVFQKAGIRFPDPTTPLAWDDVIELGKRLTRESGGQVESWGLDVWWARMWWQIPRQLGLADVYQGDEHVLKLDHPTAIEGLQWLADLRVKHKISRPPGYPGPATDFRSGKLAMNAAGAWDAANNRRDMQDDWDWLPLPQFKGKKRVTMGQASPVIMGAASKVKDQAWQLMRYLAGPVGQELAMERGTSQPILKAQHNHPAFTKARPPHTHQVVVDEVKFAVPPPYGPSYLEVQALVDKVMAPVYSGEQSARQAITAALPEFKRIMEESKARFG